jgi:hypothetical protein
MLSIRTVARACALFALTLAGGCGRDRMVLVPELETRDKTIALETVSGTCKVTEKPQNDNPAHKQKVKKNGIAFYRIYNQCSADAVVRAADFERIGDQGQADPLEPGYQQEITVKAGQRGIMGIAISPNAGHGERDVEYRFKLYVNNQVNDPVIIVDK